MINIKRAGYDEAEFIALLARITFTETFAHYFRNKQDLIDYYQKTFSVAKIRSSLQKTTNVYWLALVDDLPVGYAKLKLDSPSEFLARDKNICQLQKIYVLQDFLGLKLGFSLQETLLDYARQGGCNAIWLSVLLENDRAINFYKRSQFEEIGRHDFTIGQERFDFMAMSKSLNA